MLLKDIYEGSTYMTDEEMSTDQSVAAANQAIAEINAKVGTKLPFYKTENYQEIEYDAFSNSWQLRLIEPYLSFAIATNDSDTNARDFHYNRFLSALSEFRNKGLDDIKKFYIDEMISYKSGKVELHAKLCKDGESLINCDCWLNLEDCVEVNEE